MQAVKDYVVMMIARMMVMITVKIMISCVLRLGKSQKGRTALSVLYLDLSIHMWMVSKYPLIIITKQVDLNVLNFHLSHKKDDINNASIWLSHGDDFVPFQLPNSYVYTRLLLA